MVKPVQLKALTGLRFVAAAVVLLHHLPLALPGLLGIVYVAQAGYVGVTFFFVLSGFVLAYGWTSTSRISEFYGRRAARIYPLHALTALAMLLMLLRSGLDWSALPFNLALVQAWSPDAAVHLSFVGASWSLSCEVFFYACFPLLFAVLQRAMHPIRWAVGIIACTLGLGVLASGLWPSLGEYLYHVPLFRLTDFAVGILIALAVRQGWRVGVRPIAAAALVISTYLLVLVVQTAGRTGAQQMWLFSAIMVLPFGLLIAAFAGHELDGGRSLFASRRAVALGQWSFALYLVHGVILAALHDHVHGLRGAPAFVVGVAVVALIITSSWLVYSLYERPVELWARRRLVTRVRRPAASTASTSSHGSRVPPLSSSTPLP